MAPQKPEKGNCISPPLNRPCPNPAPPGDIRMLGALGSDRTRHLPRAFTPSPAPNPLTSRGQFQSGRPPAHHKPSPLTTTTKKSNEKTTKTPPPTSPHKLNHIAVFDVVAEVADIHAVLPLAVL